MTPDPKRPIDATWESADPQDATPYAYDDRGPWVELIVLGVAACAGSIVTLLCLWMAGAL